jgi:hypothetical protein
MRDRVHELERLVISLRRNLNATEATDEMYAVLHESHGIRIPVTQDQLREEANLGRFGTLQSVHTSLKNAGIGYNESAQLDAIVARVRRSSALIEVSTFCVNAYTPRSQNSNATLMRTTIFVRATRKQAKRKIAIPQNSTGTRTT